MAESPSVGGERVEPANGVKTSVSQAATTDGLPVAPSLEPTLKYLHIPARPALLDRRALAVIGLSICLGITAGWIAELLRRIIVLVTNVSFYGQFSLEHDMPADAVPHLGLWVVAIPVIGGIVVGLMARFGSRGIRGHGIPEAMEQVLTNESRIPARITWLKPMSAAIAIGTGGPFGAEGPIIATGSALGSLIGQLLAVTSAERKTLLAAGAAAGMAATFGSPVSAVLLAIELLLFEFRARSLIAVCLASATAAAVHYAVAGSHPMFEMAELQAPTAGAMVAYIVIGGVVGAISTLVTRAVYLTEDLFGKLPVHWMWWPAIGGVFVGAIGYIVPLTLGVGYPNITNILGNRWTLGFVALLVVAKFVSWVIALGSGTSGGTLAPLFTMGGGLGVLLGAMTHAAVPGVAIDLRVAALLGMAAIFAGASRALLTSIVFAFETTLQPMGLLPLLGGCTVSYLVSCLLMPNTIMTEKIARRGVRVPSEYMSDFLDQVLVRDAATKNIIALPADKSVAETRAWLVSEEGSARHQGFPVVNGAGNLVGVLTRRDLADAKLEPAAHVGSILRRPPVVVYDDCSLREAADHMVRHDIGRLPVVSRAERGKLVGMITRSDLLKAHRRRISESEQSSPPTVTIPFFGTKRL